MRRAFILALLLPVAAALAAGEPGYGPAYGGGYRNAGTPAAGGPPPTNYLVASDGFDGAAWGGDNPNTTVVGGQADPFGGTDAEFIISGGTAGVQEISTAVVLSDADVTASMFIRSTPGPAAGSGIRLYDGVTVYGLVLSWSAGVPSISGGTNDGQGVTSVGGGWYRVWFTVDLATRGLQGDSFTFRVVPWNSSTTPGDNIVAIAAQVEPGTVPGKVLRK